MCRKTFHLFFFNDTATTEIYTLSLHDALPICRRRAASPPSDRARARARAPSPDQDRKSTRLNSSHLGISYAVFCLKKKNNKQRNRKESQHDVLRVLSEKYGTLVGGRQGRYYLN